MNTLRKKAICRNAECRQELNIPLGKSGHISCPKCGFRFWQTSEDIGLLKKYWLETSKNQFGLRRCVTWLVGLFFLWAFLFFLSSKNPEWLIYFVLSGSLIAYLVSRRLCRDARNNNLIVGSIETMSLFFLILFVVSLIFGVLQLWLQYTTDIITTSSSIHDIEVTINKLRKFFVAYLSPSFQNILLLLIVLLAIGLTPFFNKSIRVSKFFSHIRKSGQAAYITIAILASFSFGGALTNGNIMKKTAKLDKTMQEIGVGYAQLVSQTSELLAVEIINEIDERDDDIENLFLTLHHEIERLNGKSKNSSDKDLPSQNNSNPSGPRNPGDGGNNTAENVVKPDKSIAFVKLLNTQVAMFNSSISAASRDLTNSLEDKPSDLADHKNIPKALTSESIIELNRELAVISEFGSGRSKSPKFRTLTEQAVQVFLETTKPQIGEILDPRYDLFPFREQVLEILGIFVESPVVDIAKAAAIDLADQFVANRDVKKLKDKAKSKAVAIVDAAYEGTLRNTISALKARVIEVKNLIANSDHDSSEILENQLKNKFDREWNYFVSKYSKSDRSVYNDVKEKLTADIDTGSGIQAAQAYQELSKLLGKSDASSRGSERRFIRSLENSIKESPIDSKPPQSNMTMVECTCRVRRGGMRPTSCDDYRCGPVRIKQ